MSSRWSTAAPSPIRALLRGLIATPIITKGPATLGTTWESHGMLKFLFF